MWTLTGFADEISPELDEQLDTLTDESIRSVELRSVWNKNVLDLTDDEIEKVGARCRSVVSVSRPLALLLARSSSSRISPAPGEVPPGIARREVTGSPVRQGLLFLHA